MVVQYLFNAKTGLPKCQSICSCSGFLLKTLDNRKCTCIDSKKTKETVCSLSNCKITQFFDLCKNTKTKQLKLKHQFVHLIRTGKLLGEHE